MPNLPVKELRISSNFREWRDVINLLAKRVNDVLLISETETIIDAPDNSIPNARNIKDFTIFMNLFLED